MLSNDFERTADTELNFFDLDRNGTMCYNPLALAGTPYTVHNTVEMETDLTYDPGESWLDKLFEWWGGIAPWIKAVVGTSLIIVSIGLAFIPGASAGLAFLQSAVIQLVLGVGLATVGWMAFGDGSTESLVNSLVDALFFTGLFLFIQSAIGALKYAFRSKPTVIDGVEIQHAQQSDFTPEAWERIQSLNHRADGSTISTMTDGRFIHTGFKTSQGLGKELTKPGVGRFDYINMTKKIIYELKPNNAWSITRGIRQLHRYNVGMGGGYKLVLVLY